MTSTTRSLLARRFGGSLTLCVCFCVRLTCVAVRKTNETWACGNMTNYSTLFWGFVNPNSDLVCVVCVTLTLYVNIVMQYTLNPPPGINGHIFLCQLYCRIGNSKFFDGRQPCWDEAAWYLATKQLLVVGQHWLVADSWRCTDIMQGHQATHEGAEREKPHFGVLAPLTCLKSGLSLVWISADCWTNVLYNCPLELNCKPRQFLHIHEG